jgi:hypothetical protein
LNDRYQSRKNTLRASTIIMIAFAVVFGLLAFRQAVLAQQPGCDAYEDDRAQRQPTNTHDRFGRKPLGFGAAYKANVARSGLAGRACQPARFPPSPNLLAAVGASYSPRSGK